MDSTLKQLSERITILQTASKHSPHSQEKYSQTKTLKQLSTNGGKNPIITNNDPNQVLKILLKRQRPLLQFNLQRKLPGRRLSLKRIQAPTFQNLDEHQKIILSSLMKPFARGDVFFSLVHLIPYSFLIISSVINLFFSLM